MSEAQRHCIATEKDATDLLYDLDNAYYFDENLFENFEENFSGQILRKKALAFDKLSSNEFLPENIKEECFCRAEDCINRAVDIFALHPGNPKNVIQYIDILWDKATLAFNHENFAVTRNRIIAFLHHLSDTDDTELPLKGYNLVTELLFNSEYNPFWLMVMIDDASKISSDVRDEIFQIVREQNLSDDNIDYLSNTFTHAVNPEERQTILIVNEILNASNVDFNKIQQVFTVDRIPHDITFNGERHPQAGMIYALNPNNSTDYINYHIFDDNFKRK